MEDYSEIIAKNLTLLRKSRELTQQDFAKLFNYSDKTISKWELGYAIPSVETLKQIADYYGVTVDYFLVQHEELPEQHKAKYISTKTRRILLLCLVDLFFLLVSATAYAAVATSIEGMNYWPVFIWGVSLGSFFNAVMVNKWWRYTYLPHIFSSLTIWSTLIGIYFTLIWSNVNYNFWYLFFVGFPIQLATIIILTLARSSTKN